MNHSPEPWTVGVTYERLFGQNWPVYRLKDMRDDGDQSEVEANRKLIEAAPVMLAALRMAQQELCFGGDWENAARIVQAAIRKAGGG